VSGQSPSLGPLGRPSTQAVDSHAGLTHHHPEVLSLVLPSTGLEQGSSDSNSLVAPSTLVSLVLPRFKLFS